MLFIITYFIMIFDYIESRRGHTGVHILDGCCKLCNIKQSVWHFDESHFMTTKKLYNQIYAGIQKANVKFV